ncbi:DUF3124 domain-containing protein [Phormidium tenue]|uniref:DUF3124 domain-containing protein n=1 Tax=Phormidium tenue NIES-30 TaxID=549789 RepID=A0A1U7J344_9CYAN|nr:DUF3124 domain-containing protein [Phormidium tenue]MBD2233142.1 DUF3124 domain-containing protein [Phormidium tenue FACHB-1052]OKH46673.1 hypothetical protein NIES30_16410 [Phormidium tenue NIES-30]
MPWKELLISLSLGMLAACAPQAPATSPSPPLSAQERFGERPGVTVLAAAPASAVQGQTLYVPVYSEIFDSETNRAFQLTVTLSLRNSDRNQPIVLTTLDYYNSGGDRLVTYLDAPIQLGPLASTEVVVDRSNTTGGVGANFIVEWQSAAPVSAPVVEAVMISTASQQGMSFVSPARVIEDLPAQ